MFLLKLFNIVLSKSVFIPFDMDLCDFFQGHRGQLTNGLDFSVGGENCPYLFHCKGVHVNLCSNLLRIKTSPYYLLLKWMTKLILVVNRSNLAWDLKLPKSWVMSSHFPLFPGLLRAGRPSTCALLRTPCSFETESAEEIISLLMQEKSLVCCQPDFSISKENIRQKLKASAKEKRSGSEIRVVVLQYILFMETVAELCLAV